MRGAASMRFYGVFVLATFSCGCLVAPPALRVGSCAERQGEQRSCVEYGDGYSLEVARAACSSATAQFSTLGCLTNERTGRCTLTGTLGGEPLWYVVNYYRPATTAQAHDACDASASPGVTADFVGN